MLTAGRSITGALLAVVALAGCESMSPAAPAEPPPPQPMSTIEQTAEVSATVQSIDVAKRLLSLKAEDGRVVTVEVDPAVRNLAQVKVGDRVVARYREAIGARIATTGGQEVTVDVDATRANPGERPHAQASTTTNVPVTITAVDTNSNVVSFFGSDGLVRAITIETPQGKEFIKQLKPGDTVIVSFTEALAVSVEPAK